MQKNLNLKDMHTESIESGLPGPYPTQKQAIASDTSPIPIAIPRKLHTRRTPALSNAHLHIILNSQDTTQFHQLLSRCPP
jgi:hypothetical protein